MVESLNVRPMFVGKGLCGGELKCEGHVCREGQGLRDLKVIICGRGVTL